MVRVAGLEVSLVLPSYNSQSDLEMTLAEMQDYFSQRPYSCEIIVVNDGSTDGTEEVLRKVEPLYPHLRVLHNDKNRGKGYSVRRGVLSASGRFVLYTDADRAYATDGIEALLAPLRDGLCEVAVGSRMHPLSCVQFHPSRFGYLYRRYLWSRTFNRMIRRMFRLPVSDVQCGFKGFEARAARAVFSLVRTCGFAFDVEALMIAHHLGYRIVEVPVTCLYRSEATTVKLLASAGPVLRDLVKIFLRRRERGGGPLEVLGSDDSEQHHQPKA